MMPAPQRRFGADPLIGQTLAGRFKITGQVGVGGMGTVYRAEQAGLGRAIALKVLKKELVSDRDTVARFHREAKAMSKLVHANTVRVFDFGEDDAGHLYLAMELLEGELLTTWSEREGTPPIEESIGVIDEILGSLSEAHSKGIVHRDLKPDNIYLAQVDGGSKPVVKVLDFGIAKVFRADAKIDQLETQAGTVFGTPRYMSPEQAQGRDLDHRSDLYTVGVLLYQLLTGHPPFMDEDAVVVMAKHIREPPLSPRRALPHLPIPRRLEAVLMKSLAKEPKDRCNSADAFARELRDCLPAIRAAANRSGRHVIIEKVSRWPRVPVLFGAGLVMAATLFAIVLVLSTSPPGPLPSSRSATETALGSGLPAPTFVDDQAPEETEPTAAPEVVRSPVTLISAPLSASIFEGDTELGVTPHTFDLADGEVRTLSLRAAGHESSEIELMSEMSPSIVITLERLRQRRPGKRPARRRTPEPESAPAPAQPAGPYSLFD